MVGNVTISDARLEITYSNDGAVDMDMVSLFPKNTFRNRANGLRADLATTIADMKPRFVRFPGGCVAHGDGIDNIYHWKNTIGPVEQRKPQRNLWGYHQSFGLGYFEYFQFCEDMGAEPVRGGCRCTLPKFGTSWSRTGRAAVRYSYGGHGRLYSGCFGSH
ncbi:hypothetical protein L950_0212965 [Sphingobacterium sp. IITKGP-BTPF85]|nr:hypothetical protein [Sphingobacterium sp. IITKGP-BTPF85]KKX49921.1 hypothetical protein L950_0212965 [Sphingobacterium sp. IITKGP-BTPF85]